VTPLVLEQERAALDDDDERSAFRQYVKPRVAELLAAVGLDVVYHRAQGDYLFYRGNDGKEVRVLDLLGGFGASLFGHNHPYLMARAKEALAEQRPFNAQASVRGRAGLLGRRLARMVGEATGREYMVTFANSGAEAVEAALKHAELEVWERGRRAVEQVRESTVVVTRQLAAGTAVIPEGFFDEAERQLGGERSASLDDLGRLLEKRAKDAFRRPPAFLALAGAFHGKTSGALKLTHNFEYRHPWDRWGSALFLSRGDIAELRAKVARAKVDYFRLEVGADARVKLTVRSTCNISAAFVEPLQGEGGINEISAEYLAELRRCADEAGFPVVIDEIQSGMGRTGTFLASAPSGIRGDYYLLSKSLGGGLAKIAAVLVDRTRYQPDFGYLHTSTFAEDDFSSTVAMAALDLLEQDDGRVMRACREKGEYLLQRLRQIQARYPEQIRDVRGRGLMLGIELQPQIRSRSALLRVLSEQRLLGFFAAGHLLHEERIRVAPGLSSHGTIRIEPSAEISTADMDHLCDALERLCRVIQDSDVHRFSRFAFGRSATLALATDEPENEVRPPRPTNRDHAAQPIAFLLHYMRPEDLRRLDAGMRAFDTDACRQFIDKTRSVLKPFVAERALVRSVSGETVDLSIIAVPFSAEQAMTAMRSRSFGWALSLVKEGVELARSLGCVYAGLGGHTSIVSNNCCAIVADDIGVTSGNALTVAVAVEALLGAAARRGVSRRRLAVVGATGNIGAMIAALAADEVDEIVLVGRSNAARRLARLAEQLGNKARVATDLSALRDCPLIISATNSPTPIILPEHIGDAQPVVICDVAVPGDAHRSLAQTRPNATVIGGGLMRLPLGQDLGRLGVEGAPGLVYACMAETILLGFAKAEKHFSYGALQPGQVRFIRALAKAHGFTTEEKLV
jgi:acetylornithine/succinyldiaminopimelate/putrescine aminotransferase/predicted amino acid dehydrogenase